MTEKKESVPKQIAEEDGVHKEWYAEAREMTVEKLPEFVRKLTQDYQHDYGTICHAIAAAAVGAAWAVEKSPSGGITGFQAGAVMWEIIRAWGVWEEGPKRMVCYRDMLYPQMESKFRAISADTAKWIREEAQKTLKVWSGGSPKVKDHLERVAEGYIPFGFRVEED